MPATVTIPDDAVKEELVTFVVPVAGIVQATSVYVAKVTAAEVFAILLLLSLNSKIG